MTSFLPDSKADTALDVILHRVFRKEAAHLLIELRGQCLVMAENQCRSPHVGNDVSHCERLARARHAQQYLSAVASLHTVGELADGLGLVAGGLKA